MSYQVLARKWRPTNFQQMVGQEHVLQALINALDSSRLHHAYLFSGTRGVGKTTVARIFAKALNCEQGISSKPCGSCSSCVEIDEGRSVDLIEIDAASRTGVDDMRELLDNVQYAPTRGRFKVYLIDEVHMLSRHSFNALLKTLEEPPPHVKFLLATTDPQKVPVTVLSRCLQFNLKRMSRAQILSQLQFLTGQEEIDAELDALGQLAGAADGSMRDALSLLDQAIGYGAGEVKQETVQSMLGSIARDYLFRLFDALVDQQAATILREARTVIEHNPDYQRVCAEMISLMQQIALFQTHAGLVDPDDYPAEILQKYGNAWSPEEIQLYYQIMLQGRHDLLLCPDEASGFEMLMLRLIAFAPPCAAEPMQDTVKKKPEAGPELTRQPGYPAKQAEPPVQQPDPAAQLAQQALPNEDSNTAAAQTEAGFDWPGLAYHLGLTGLAQEIVANSVVESFRDGRLRLALLPEIHELATAVIGSEIRQALEQKLEVSLQLELIAMQPLHGITPLQAKSERLEQERMAVIEAIREDAAVRKLQRAFAVELDEASVVKIDNTGN